MEVLFALVALALAAWVLLAPLVAFLKLRRLVSEVARARLEVGALAGRLQETERKLERLAARAGAAPPERAVPNTSDVEKRAAITEPSSAPTESEPPLDSAGGAAVPVVGPRRDAPSPALESSVRAPRSSEQGVEPSVASDGAPRSLEQTIGVVWLTRIGASAVLLGTAYFFKYAVENDWIGPWPRVATGVTAGIAALFIGERSRERAHRAWADLVTALGMGLLLFAAYASHVFYALVPLEAAFAAFFVVSCLGGALSVVHSSETILVVSLAAACSAPPLLSSGQDRPLGLFGYLFVVTALSHAAALYRSFRIALWLGLVGPAVLFTGWYVEFFDVDGAYASLASRAVPLGTAAAFLAMWVVVHFRARAVVERKTNFVALYAAAASTAAFAALLYDRAVVAGSVMVALGGLFAALATRERSPMLLLVSLAASGVSLLVLPESATLNPGVLGITAAWASVYFAAAAHALLVVAHGDYGSHQRPALLVATASGLVFIAVAFRHGVGESERLASFLFAAVGAIDLALGAALVARAGGRVVAAAPLGLALGLFAASIAFLFAGPVVTVAWAALAATVVWLSASRGDVLWLAGALLLFGATLVRLLAVDWDAPLALRDEFVRTLGAGGSVEPPLFLNVRAYALAGAGAALLVAARIAAHVGRRSFRFGSGALALLGHVVVLALCVSEARNAATPALSFSSAGLDTSDVYRLLNEHQQTVSRAAHRLSMVTTLVFGAYATLLVSIGFGAREPGHRYLGLALFAITLGKLLVFDVWQLERVYQILILVSVGVLLLGASFLYARFGGRLFKILGRGGSAAAVVFGISFPRAARAAVDTTAFSHVTEISGVAAPGLYRLDVVAPLYRRSHTEETLADVRITGPHGEETPYFVRSLAEPATGGHPASMLDPVVFPDGRVRASFDLGVAPVRHGSARLGIDGEDFLRQTLVEVSDDGKEFAQIQEGSVVYRASHGATASESLEVVYPTSAARYVRVTLAPGGGDIVGFTGAEFFVPATSKAPLQRFEIAVLRTDRNTTEKTTTVILDAGEPGVPIERIAFEPETDNTFQRFVDVSAANDPVHWFPVGSGFLYRLPTRAGGRNESLALDVGRSRKRFFSFQIHDGDDVPIGVRGTTAEYLPEEIVFRAAAAGPHRLFVGCDSLRRPSYDLASVVVRAVDPPKEASLSPLAENPDYVTPRARQTFSQKYGRYFATAFAVIVLSLAAFTFRLLRSIPRNGA